MRSFSLGDRSAASSKAFSAGRVLQGQSVAKSTLSAPWSFTSWVKLAASKKWEAKAVSKYTFFFPARCLAASWGVSMPPMWAAMMVSLGNRSAILPNTSAGQ